MSPVFPAAYRTFLGRTYIFRLLFISFFKIFYFHNLYILSNTVCWSGKDKKIPEVFLWQIVLFENIIQKSVRSGAYMRKHSGNYLHVLSDETLHG